MPVLELFARGNAESRVHVPTSCFLMQIQSTPQSFKSSGNKFRFQHRRCPIACGCFAAKERRSSGLRASKAVCSQSRADAVELKSLTSSLVKRLVKLRTSSAYRTEYGCVVVPGATAIQEILNSSDVLVKTLILANGQEACLPGVSADSYLTAAEAVLRKISGLQNVEGLQAIAELQLPAYSSFERRDIHLTRLLVLERVQDPGNVGTLLRTAQAFGWQGVFLLPGCADPFNDKALRASKGAAFRIPIGRGDWSDLQRIRDSHSLLCVAAAPESEAPSSPESSGPSGYAPPARQGIAERQLPGFIDFEMMQKQKICLVLGSEGEGLSDFALEVCDKRLSIPMPGGMESLNVAVAGSVLMFMLSGGLPELLEDVAFL